MAAGVSHCSRKPNNNAGLVRHFEVGFSGQGATVVSPGGDPITKPNEMARRTADTTVRNADAILKESSDDWHRGGSASAVMAHAGGADVQIDLRFRARDAGFPAGVFSRARRSPAAAGTARDRGGASALQWLPHHQWCSFYRGNGGLRGVECR